MERRSAASSAASEDDIEFDLSAILASYEASLFFELRGADPSSVIAGKRVQIDLVNISPPLDVSTQRLKATIAPESASGDDSAGDSSFAHPPPCFVEQLSRSSASISFGITRSGNYSISVCAETLSDHLSHSTLKASRIPLTVLPASPSPSRTDAKGQGLTCCAPEQAASFTVTTYDKFGNRRRSGGEDVGVEIQGSAIDDGAVVDRGDGTYTVTYTPKFAGGSPRASLSRSTLPLHPHREGFIISSTSVRRQWSYEWFVMKEGFLISYGK